MAQAELSHNHSDRSASQRQAEKQDHSPDRYSPARIAGIYLLAGMIWIGLTDFTLAWSGGLTSLGFYIANGKGLLFVLLSSGLVYGLCRRDFQNSARTMGLLRAVVESTVRETEARLREAQKIAKLGSWSWNPQINKVWWSDAEFELFGVTPMRLNQALTHS